MAKRAAKGDEEDGSMDDRISELPHHISHHILSLLSQRKAFRACVLSKTWHHLVSTRPNFTLREKWFAQDKQAFHSVLERTLQRYLDQKLSIRAFVLELPYDPACQSLSLLEKWVPTILVRLGVEVFDLTLTDYCYSATFDLPSAALFESKSLRELYLERCNISENNIADKVLFRHLERLYLKNVYISDETFEKIMSSCPLIDFLVLHTCGHALKTIKIAKNKHLSLVEYFCCAFGGNYPSIEIDHVPAIVSISIERCSNWVYQKKSFPCLVSLDLHTVRLCSKSLDIFSSNFPCLEKLSITECHGFEELKLLTPSIKHLTVNHCELIEATIDAPNILSFEYGSGGFLPSSISFTTTRSECKSEIFLLNNTGDGYGGFLAWALRLNGLVKALSQSQVSMKISYTRSPLEDGLDADCGGFCEHVAVEHLSLRGNLSNSSFPAFLNLLFRACRPRYLSGCSYMGNRHTNNKCLFKILVKDRESRDNNDNFWQQDLEQVIVETSDDCGKTLHHRVGETSFRKENNSRFRLKWRNS